jgi:hypothetical protein
MVEALEVLGPKLVVNDAVQVTNDSCNRIAERRGELVETLKGPAVVVRVKGGGAMNSAIGAGS